jgi:hypothetical protein
MSSKFSAARARRVGLSAPGGGVGGTGRAGDVRGKAAGMIWVVSSQGWVEDG